jgi:chorismate synthase
MLRYLTAGESHGKGLTAILEGMVADLSLSSEDINKDLARRQGGYGRGERMKIEKDKAEMLSGVRNGKTIGSPISIIVKNLDWENWEDVMTVESGDKVGASVTNLRPGHADLAGVLKYGQKDIRNILERASARETAARVAVGAVAKRFLSEFNIIVGSHVVGIGGIRYEVKGVRENNLEALLRKAETSQVRCADEKVSKQMMAEIDKAASEGDSLGGVFEVVVLNCPVGLGSHVHWDRKLKTKLAAALMSIQAVKGVEIGMGFEAAALRGSQVHDEIFYENGKFTHKTNNAGGLEGGITNGEPIILRAAVKPIATLRKPLKSVDIVSKKPTDAHVERSDTCAVPAAGVIGEAVASFEVANALLEKFGGDSLKETLGNFKSYQKDMLNM